MAHQIYVHFNEGVSEKQIERICHNNYCKVVLKTNFTETYVIETDDVINFYTLGMAIGREKLA